MNLHTHLRARRAPYSDGSGPRGRANNQLRWSRRSALAL